VTRKNTSSSKGQPADAKAKKESGPPVRFPLLLVWMTLGMLLVLNARFRGGESITLLDLIPYTVWAGSAFLFCSLLWSGRYQGPRALPVAILGLSAVGVLVRSRMAGAVEGMDGLALWIQPTGFLWMWLAWIFSRRGRLESWKGFGPLAYLAAVALVGGLILLGSRFRGAFFGPGGMTPSELLKVFIPVWLAWGFTTDHQRWRNRPLWNPPFVNLTGLCFFWAVLCGLLVVQRDLGMVVLLSLTLLVMLVQVTRSWSWAVASLVAIAAAGWAILEWVAHGARRMEAWLDPFADPTGSGWQVLQGLSGLYAGGLLGTGFGEGRPDRLPIADSDFVYAVVGEELGYIGCLLLLLLFAAVVKQSAASCQGNPNLFSSVLGAGLTAQLAIQVFVNIAGVVTLLPVTGIPLPYISQGGTSFWVTSVQFGLLLGIGDWQKKSSSG
jgi:cell division protein FtsW (lipid II flippase)